MKKNLLIVEDDEDIRQMMRLYFQKKYNIFEAETGKDAIQLGAISQWPLSEIIKSKPPDSVS